MTGSEDSTPVWWLRGRASRLTLGLLVVVHVGLLAWSAWRYSPTLNESSHLPAGLSIWRFGRFDLYCVNPPLIRMTASLPLLFVPHEEDWSRYRDGPGIRAEWNVGSDFIAANGSRSFWLMTISRWMCIPFSVIGLLVCWTWGRELSGPAAGLAAATLWAFCPNVLGHGSLITPDIAAVSLGLFAAWRCSRWLECPDWKNAILAGISLGLALLAKSYWTILLIIWPGLWGAQRWVVARRNLEMPQTSSSVQSLQLLVILLIGGHLLNLGYLYQGTGTRLGEFPFVSQAFTGQAESPATTSPGNRFRDTALAWVPIPFPRDFVLGIDLQTRDFERPLNNYLLGEWRQQGWWYFYLIGIFVKVPLGTWCLVLLGAWRLCRDPGGGNWLWKVAPLAVPALTILTMSSMQRGLQHHVRYVFSVLPLLFLVGGLTFGIGRTDVPRPTTVWRVAGVIGLLATIAGSLLVFPHGLSYFNELVARPGRRGEILLHSNFDWGQDLIYVREWLDAHPERRPVTIGFQPHLPLDVLGIDAERTSSGRIRPGWHIISQALIKDPRSPLRRFAEFDAVEQVGGTMNVYLVQKSPVDQTSNGVDSD